MEKDYAKYPYSGNREFIVRGWRGRLLFVVILLLLMMGLGSGFYLWKKHQNSFVTWASGIKSSFFHKNEKPILSAGIKNEESQNSEVQFHFYTELPNMQLARSDSGNTHASKKSNIKSQYVIQIGKFDNEKEASEVRISLLLVGFETKVVKSKTNNGEIFLLQQGPFTNHTDAKKILARLKHIGYKNAVITPL